VTVLVISGSGRVPLAAKTTPAALPVVAAMGSDPGELGVVASLNQYHTSRVAEKEAALLRATDAHVLRDAERLIAARILASREASPRLW
jgi:hypothetical protein